jgi:hypothetical protein
MPLYAGGNRLGEPTSLIATLPSPILYLAFAISTVQRLNLYFHTPQRLTALIAAQAL